MLGRLGLADDTRGLACLLACLLPSSNLLFLKKKSSNLSGPVQFHKRNLTGPLCFEHQGPEKGQVGTWKLSNMVFSAESSFWHACMTSPFKHLHCNSLRKIMAS